jgi:hypothetical protein
MYFKIYIYPIHRPQCAVGQVHGYHISSEPASTQFPTYLPINTFSTSLPCMLHVLKVPMSFNFIVLIIRSYCHFLIMGFKGCNSQQLIFKEPTYVSVSLEWRNQVPHPYNQALHLIIFSRRLTLFYAYTENKHKKQEGGHNKCGPTGSEVLFLLLYTPFHQQISQTCHQQFI